VRAEPHGRDPEGPCPKPPRAAPLATTVKACHKGCVRRLRDSESVVDFLSGKEIDEMQAAIDARREARAAGSSVPTAPDPEPEKTLRFADGEEVVLRGEDADSALRQAMSRAHRRPPERVGNGYDHAKACREKGRFAVRRMFAGDVRRARSVGRRITDARRAGDRNKELAYRRRAEGMVARFGPEARREVEIGRREQMRSRRG